MGVKISMGWAEGRSNGLTYLFGIDATVEIEAYTVRQILQTIIGNHPAKGKLLTDEGELRRFISLAINEDIFREGGMDIPLKEGDEVVILPAICTLLFQVIQRDFLLPAP